MTKEPKRKLWSEDETRLAWELQRKGTPTKKILQQLNKMFGNNRSSDKLYSRMSAIRLGKVKVNFDIKSDLPVYDLNSVKGVEEWTEEQNQYIYEIRKSTDGSKPIEYSSLSEEFYEKFGIRRTVKALQIQYHKIRKIKEKKADSQESILEPKPIITAFLTMKEAEEPGSEKQKERRVFLTLSAFDSSNLKRIYEKRRDYIYQLMSEQAKKILRFDSLKKYSNMDLSGILKLPLNERGIVKKILESEGDEIDIKNIELFAIPSQEFGSYGSLVLPVFVSNEQSAKNLASCLDDAVNYALVTEKVFEETGVKVGHKLQYKGRFRDLKMYYFEYEKNTNLIGLSTKLEKLLDPEYGGIGIDIVGNNTDPSFFLLK